MFTSNCYLFNMESKIASYEILNKGELPKAEDLFDPDRGNLSQEFDEDEEEDFFEGRDELYKSEDESDAEEIELEANPLVELSKSYFMEATALLKRVEKKYHFYGAPKDKINDPNLSRIRENFEIFGWYHAFIGAKVSRAVNGKMNASKEEDEESRSFEEHDMNGSAKVAMISIERSINSLSLLYSLLPEYTEEISDLLIKAGMLRNGVEKEFPEYKNFKRPGFD